MIPAIVQARLRQRYSAYDHHAGPGAAEPGEARRLPRAAKALLVRVGDDLVVAVVGADARLNLHPLEEAIGAHAEVAASEEVARRFGPCEPGAVAPLAIFGVPIYVDDDLAREPRVLLPAGTHQDVVELDTGEWIWAERVRTINHLGPRLRLRAYRR